jgi:3-phenylpropionate/trans-cinnamate dioxygenase ferredoxin subunit
MEYVKVAMTNELDAGQKKLVTVQGKAILLTNIQGSFYAIDNTCPHMGGSLYEGNLDGTHIVCPKHGSIFDVTTGQVVQSGKLFLIKVKVHDVQSYPVQIEGTDLLIGME